MSEKVTRFTDLRVWRKAHAPFVLLAGEVDAFPSRKASGIVADQLLRSIGSVCANMAEGFNRSRKRFVNSLDIALGEANETENWLYKARDAGLMQETDASERILAIIEVQKMLTSLKREIAARPDRIAEQEAEYSVWDGE